VNRDSPIVPKRVPVPGPILAAIDRWRVVGKPGVLVKTYLFRDRSGRDAFVVGALGHEAETEHAAEYVIRELEVTVSLTTPGIGATELDRDHARTYDVLFREIAYSPSTHGIRDPDE